MIGGETRPRSDGRGSDRTGQDVADALACLGEAALIAAHLAEVGLCCFRGVSEREQIDALDVLGASPVGAEGLLQFIEAGLVPVVLGARLGREFFGSPAFQDVADAAGVLVVQRVQGLLHLIPGLGHPLAVAFDDVVGSQVVGRSSGSLALELPEFAQALLELGLQLGHLGTGGLRCCWTDVDPAGGRPLLVDAFPCPLVAGAPLCLW